MVPPPCIRGRATGLSDKDHSQSGRPRNRSGGGRTGWLSALRIDLTEEPNFPVPACLCNREGISQLGHIDSDKCFPIICHGSSSCDEDRLGPPEQPSDAQCRASHLIGRDGHTVLHLPLVPLPPACPELNAAENIWQYICARPISPTACSRTTPLFSTPARTHGENFSPRRPHHINHTTR